MIQAEYEPNEIRDGDIAAYRKLWAAVLLQAIRDWEAVERVEHRGESDTRYGQFPVKHLRTWFKSDAIHPGSFAWVCMAVGMNPERVRGKIFENPLALVGRRERV